MKVYISGRIKDYPYYLDHFATASHQLRIRDGYEVVNPCELGEPNFTYADYMRCDIKALLDCDAIYMLTGWEKSSGARTEFLVAVMCGIEILYEKEGSFVSK